MQTQLAYTIDETTELTGLCRTLLYQEIAEGKLRARKARGRTIITHADLREYLRSLPRAPRRASASIEAGADKVPA
jgi:hypothetical protein